MRYVTSQSTDRYKGYRGLTSFLRRSTIRAVRPLSKAISAAQNEVEFERVEMEKCRFQSCGSHVTISPSTKIIAPSAIAIGNNVHIGDECYINAEGGLQIQDNVHISRRVTIYCSDHAFRDGDQIPYGPFRDWRQVVIERNAWIGMNVCILPGVRIGEGAIIGMGCIVAKDVPPRQIVGQQPFRILGERDPNAYNQCIEKQAFGGRDGQTSLAEKRPKPMARGCDGEPDITFVLTTGRSGSTSIVDMFGATQEVVARHEPRQQMIKWSTQLAHREITEDEALASLEELFLNTSVYKDGIHYLESDQKYFNMALLLHRLFPRAKFIWLTRNGRDVVSSATGRGWYADETHPNYSRIPYYFHRHRLRGDLCGAMDAATWGQMSIFEKNCWYWSFVNSKIRKDLSQIPSDFWIHVRLEELDVSFKKIVQHMGVPQAKMAIKHSNSASYAVRRPQDWSKEEEQAFIEICGEEMERIYG